MVCHVLFHDTPTLLYGLKLGMILRCTQNGNIAIFIQRIGLKHMVKLAYFYRAMLID